MTPEQIEQINREWNEAKGVIAQMSTETKTHGAALGETLAKFNAINARLDEMEIAAKRRGSVSGDTKQLAPEVAEHKAAKLNYFRKGTLTPEMQTKFMQASDDSSGGFLADDDSSNEIVKGIVLWSPVRSVARIRTTGKRSVKVRKRTRTAAAIFLASERSLARAETQGPKYGLDEVPNHELYAQHDISVQDIEDAEFDIEGELNSEFSEQFGVTEGESFVNGSGLGEPEGLLTNGSIAFTNNGDASTLKFAGLVAVQHDLKSGYAAGAKWAFKRETLGLIRAMVDSQGDPLWAPMVQGAPATVLGVPYIELPDMPAVSSGNYPILFGDFRMAYMIVDRKAISVLRDPLTQATSGAVRFIARKRVGGTVVLPEAIRKLKMA